MQHGTEAKQMLEGRVVGRSAGRRFARGSRSACALSLLATLVVLAGGGSAQAAPSGPVQSPQGSWVGSYGAAGYALAGSPDQVSLSNATLSLTQGTRYTWAASTTDVRALQAPNASSRAAATYYDANQLRLSLAFSAAFNGNLRLYAIDWESGARRETITVNGQSIQLSGDFSQGAWVTFPVNIAAGQTASIVVDRVAGPNAIVSGIFLGEGSGSPPPPPSGGAPSGPVQSPQGSWVGSYGAAGYALAGSPDQVSLSNATLSLTQGTRYTWAASTTDVRALQAPNASSRAAATYYDANQLRLSLAFSAAFNGNLRLYAIDWESGARRETITVNGQSIQLSGDFSQGAWVTFPVNIAAGQTASIVVDRVAGPNAIVSGIFLGEGSGSPPPPPSGGAPSGPVQSPQGSWVGSYGAAGYALAGSPDQVSLSNATLSLTQGTRYTWAASTTDVRALQAPNASSRAAATYYDANQLRLSLAFSAAFNGNLRLYAIDWESGARRETITVNGQSIQLSGDFSQGAWVTFPVNIAAGQTASIVVDRVAGPNAIVSGIFLGEGSGSPPPPPSGGIPHGFVAVADYSPTQNVYSGDLNQFHATWWSGGATPADPTNQIPMLQNGFHYLPSFNTGYTMRTQGLTVVPASTTKSSDPHSCIDTPCGLNTTAMTSVAQSVQNLIGANGNYYDVGNEVDNSFSDGVAPSVFVGQFDAWVTAIKHGDPSAKIVGPSMNTWTCCTTTVTNPYGTAGKWFADFVAAYVRVHGVKPPLDVLAMHLYDFDPRTGYIDPSQEDYYLSDVQSFRQAANNLGYAGTPIWMTELGFINSSPGPVTPAESSEITKVMGQLVSNASALNLQRVFWTTSSDQAFRDDGFQPLYDPNATSSPSTPMPLTDLGRLVAQLTQ